MDKKKVIVPYAVSILLLIASFFISGPVLSVGWVPLRGRMASIEYTLGAFLIFWVISLLIIIVLETIKIWSDKLIDRNPLGPFVVLTALSSVGTIVFEIFYIILEEEDVFMVFYLLFYLLAPIAITWIYMSSRRSKAVRIIALVIASSMALLLLWSIRVICHGIYCSRFTILNSVYFDNHICLSIISVLCVLIALGIGLYMALNKKNSFKFKWCVLAIIIVATLFVPMIRTRKISDSHVFKDDRISIIENFVEEKTYLFGFVWQYGQSVTALEVP